LTKISKEKDCEALADWVVPCQNHFMWSATSTHSGDGEVIWAKFRSFLFHIVNKHKDLPNPRFDKCYHDENIPHRRWLEEGLFYQIITLVHLHCDEGYSGFCFVQVV